VKTPKEQPKGLAWRAAEAHGFDMSLVEANLRRTPRERLLAHDRALRTAQRLRVAMEKREHAGQ
jgi:hypothetical protein